MEFPTMQKIIHILFVAACILIIHPSFAVKGEFRFYYGCFALEGEQKQAVLKMFKDYNEVFTDPEAFTIPPKSSLTVEDVAMAEHWGNEAERMIKGWGNGRLGEQGGLIPGTVYLFQTAQIGFPHARGWLLDIYNILTKYYTEADPNPEQAKIYEQQARRLSLNSPLERRWDNAERLFYKLPEEKRAELRAQARTTKLPLGITVSAQPKPQTLPGIRKQFIEGPRIDRPGTAADSFGNEDEGATETSCFLTPTDLSIPPRFQAPNLGKKVSSVFSHWVASAARLVCAGSPHDKTD
jgi:hypothetical protein